MKEETFERFENSLDKEPDNVVTIYSKIFKNVYETIEYYTYVIITDLSIFQLVCVSIS